MCGGLRIGLASGLRSILDIRGADIQSSLLSLEFRLAMLDKDRR